MVVRSNTNSQYYYSPSTKTYPTTMEESCIISNVCVTGGSGYIASSLIKKLLEKGYNVHATVRNLGANSPLHSLPNADSNLFLFHADLLNPIDFDLAIKGCQVVFHVAHVMAGSQDSSRGKEATVDAARSILNACVGSGSVRRLIYTASVTATSPVNEDGVGFKSCMDESCWTPLDHLISLTHATTVFNEYTRTKTLVEKELLSYNDTDDPKLEVVSLACGLVGGDTLLSSVPGSVLEILLPLTKHPDCGWGLKFLEELLGSVPLVHIEDVCDAHIFCMEKKSSLRGRFLLAAANPTIREITMYFQENHPEFKIDDKYKGEAVTGVRCNLSKLTSMGFVYKYDMKETLEDCVNCGRRLGALPEE